MLLPTLPTYCISVVSCVNSVVFRIPICFYSLSTGFVSLECILVLLHDFRNSHVNSNGRPEAAAAPQGNGGQNHLVSTFLQTSWDGRHAFYQVNLSCLFLFAFNLLIPLQLSTVHCLLCTANLIYYVCCMYGRCLCRYITC